MMDSIRQINRLQYLYLDRMVELNDLEVEFWIREAGYSKSLGNSEAAVSSYSNIQSTEDSKIYKVLFEGYIAFAVFNESYEKLPIEKTFSSRLFQTISDSQFLDYITANGDVGYAESVSAMKPRHFRLNCLNHIIDVATCFDPSIEIVSGKNEFE